MKKNVLTFIKQERTWEILFLGFLFCFYVGWAYLMPQNSCPDEEMRYQVAEYIYRNGTLPHGDDPSIRNAIWGISYAFNPILAYMIGALFMKITSFVTTDPAWLLLAARMVSVLCGVGMAFFTIRIAKKLFDKSRGILFVLLVTCLPQCVFMFTYVNTDSLALFAISIIVYMWICGLESGWDWKSCTGLAIGISICALSYYNAYGFILCSIGLFGLSILFCYEKKWDYAKMLKRGALVSVIVLALIGWWFVRNYIIYDGDFLGQRTSAMCSELYAMEEFKPSNRTTPYSEGVSVWDMITKPYIHDRSWLMITAISFIGCFGYMNLFISNVIVMPYLMLLAIGLLGNVLHLKEDFIKGKKENGIRTIAFNWTMLAAMIIPNVLNIYYSYASDYQPQGRYSLPMLIPLAYFVVKGLENIFELFIKHEKIRSALCIIIGIVLFVIVLYVYKRIIRVTYLPNPLINIGI